MDTMKTDEKFYLGDLRVGQTYETASYTLTEEAIKAFAAQFDPQPFHLDEEAARDSLFQGLAASGWHTAAVTMRLLVDRGIPASGIIGAGGELAWPRPTRPGDTLRVRGEVLEIIPSRSRPDRGSVMVRNETYNQHDQLVQHFTVKLVVFERPPAG